MALVVRSGDGGWVVMCFRFSRVVVMSGGLFSFLSSAPAGTPQLIVDFNPGTASASPRPAGRGEDGEVFFLLAESATNRRIVGTFGSPGNYRVLSEGLPAPDTTSTFGDVYAGSWNGATIFQRRTFSGAGIAFQLWTTNGGGPELLATLPNQCSTVVFAGGLNTWAVRGKQLFFTAENNWLWKSDGPTAGAARLVNLNLPGKPANYCIYLRYAAALPSGLVLVVREFTDSEVEHVFGTDGTAAGTRLLRSVSRPAVTFFRFPRAAVREGRFYFCDDDTIWSTDGTVEGTREERHFSSFQRLEGLRYHDGRFWFLAKRSDGTGSALCRLGDPQAEPTQVFSPPETFIEYGFAGGHVFARTQQAGVYSKMWSARTTDDKLSLIAISNPLGDPAGYRFEPVGPRLYFVSNTPEYGHELWRSDGTIEGTELVLDAVPGPAAGVADFAASGSNIVFISTQPDYGQELFSIDTGYRAADMNCNGSLSVNDIGPFVLALTDRAAYESAYPDCDYLHADLTLDGVVSVGDIAPFVSALVAN